VEGILLTPVFVFLGCGNSSDRNNVADVPLHRGTVVDYQKTEVTASATGYQLTIETTASLDDVVAWYQTQAVTAVTVLGK
jgi:hypothetical protein